MLAAIILATAGDPAHEAVIWAPLGDRPVVAHALAPFAHLMPVVLVAPIARGSQATEVAAAAGAHVWLTHEEGSQRAALAGGLRALRLEADMILVHEGARPFVTTELVQAVAAQAGDDRIAWAAVPARDTIKQVDRAGRIITTPDRQELAVLQMPLAAPRRLLEAACAGNDATSLGELLARTGVPIVTVPGSAGNEAIRTADDLAWATQWSAAQTRP